MPITVAALLADPALALRAGTSTAPLDRPVSWVHVSELRDPTPFLDGGELLLTTGLPLAEEAGLEAYVDRLVDTGVAALGVGTGLGLDEVPAALLGAAEVRGLAVVEVPRRTPFIAISRSVAAALAAEQYASVARSAAVQQEMVRAALAPGSPGSVLRRLTRSIGGWALLVDPAGAVLDAVPGPAAERAAGLRAELDQLRRTPAPVAAAVSAPEETVLLQSIGSGSRSRAFLVVGRPGPLPPAERVLVNAAALVLTLRLEQAHSLDGATGSLRSALLELLSVGEVGTVAAVADRLGAPLPREPLRVATVRGSGEARAAVGALAAGAAERFGAALFRAEAEDDLVLVAAADGALAGRLGVLAERVPGVAVGVSAAGSWSRFAEALQQARQAALHATRRGGGVLPFAELAGAGLVELVDHEAAVAFSDALLAPLRDADPSGSGGLVVSLRTWLAHHGQWEPAAAEMGVHRHTLRKRIRRAGEMLGRDLDSPGVRAELWLALQLAP